MQYYILISRELSTGLFFSFFANVNMSSDTDELDVHDQILAPSSINFSWDELSKSSSDLVSDNKISLHTRHTDTYNV